MATVDVVSKCRECGAVRPSGFSNADHSSRDHCDGKLDNYCTVCRKFIDEAICPSCIGRAREAEELVRRRRQETIARWRSKPVLSQLHFLLRQNTWLRRALEDWEHREGLRCLQKRDLLLIATALIAGMLLPLTWRNLVLAGIFALAVLVMSLKTLPDDVTPHP